MLTSSLAALGWVLSGCCHVSIAHLRPTQPWPAPSSASVTAWAPCGSWTQGKSQALSQRNPGARPRHAGNGRPRMWGFTEQGAGNHGQG